MAEGFRDRMSKSDPLFGFGIGWEGRRRFGWDVDASCHDRSPRPGRSSDCLDGSAINADFHGRENNQPFRSWKPRFLGEFVVSALESLIVYPAQNDSIGIKSTIADS
jgi:hypothetical protein